MAQFLPAEFEYEGDEDAPSTVDKVEPSPRELIGALALLPQPQRQDLLDAARQLDKGQIITLVNSLNSLSQPVVDRICFFAETYRFDLLEEALVQAAEGEEEGAL